MGHLREPLLLGAVTLACAAMMGVPADDVHYRLCVRSEDHRTAALAAFEQGRLLLARREAQRVEASCPRIAPTLRDLELSAMVGLGECSDATDLAHEMRIEAPVCGGTDPNELASAGLAALRSGERRKAWTSFEGALGAAPQFKAGERIDLTGEAARFGDVVLACMTDGVVSVDLKSEIPTFVRRPGYGTCSLSPSNMHAWVNGRMIDVPRNVDLWSSDGHHEAFSSDGAFFLERAGQGTLRLRNAQTGDVVGTFEADTGRSVHAIGRTFQWDHEQIAWMELEADPPSLKRSLFMDPKEEAHDGRHRVVIDTARSAIVITDLATRAQVTVPVKTERIQRFALTPDGKTVITHSYGSTRGYDVATGEEVLLDGFGHGRRLGDTENTAHVSATQYGSPSVTLGEGASKHEIFLEDVPITSEEQGLSLLHASVPHVALDRAVEVKLVGSRLSLTRGVHQSIIQFFTQDRLFIESEGLFDVVGAVLVKCTARGALDPLPNEVCQVRLTPGLLSSFLAP